jgi:hypothetical protein
MLSARSKSMKWLDVWHPGNVDQQGLLLRACEGAYMRVYVSPELLVDPKFQGVLRNVTCRSHVVTLVVVDELYFMHDRGEILLGTDDRIAPRAAIIRYGSVFNRDLVINLTWSRS